MRSPSLRLLAGCHLLLLALGAVLASLTLASPLPATTWQFGLSDAPTHLAVRLHNTGGPAS